MATQAMQPAQRRAPAAEAPWWVLPLTTVVMLGAFGIYSAWEALLHDNGRYTGQGANYLSPFFSPDVTGLGIKVLPALYVVWAPLLFRATCYYYRKAYYRSFFLDPPSCAIREPRKGYSGETAFPLILNNLHRFFLYVAILVVLFLWKDAIEAFFFSNGFGVRLGSLIMLVNVILLTMYTLSCHSFRHLVGGGLDCFSCGANPIWRYGLWRRVSMWNASHAFWAWISMFSVWGADLYIRLLLNGTISDVRFF